MYKDVHLCAMPSVAVSQMLLKVLIYCYLTGTYSSRYGCRWFPAATAPQWTIYKKL